MGLVSGQALPSRLGRAMRLIAPRCLYGVDRNPVAVDLAKVSLWLVTLAKDCRGERAEDWPARILRWRAAR